MSSCEDFENEAISYCENGLVAVGYCKKEGDKVKKIGKCEKGSEYNFEMFDNLNVLIRNIIKAGGGKKWVITTGEGDKKLLSGPQIAWIVKEVDKRYKMKLKVAFVDVLEPVKSKIYVGEVGYASAVGDWLDEQMKRLGEKYRGSQVALYNENAIKDKKGIMVDSDDSILIIVRKEKLVEIYPDLLKFNK